ncbi:hypothetical protein QFC21_007190 [Naganishia friedmannii]|uniref:Uncharacterized protein n=1 Tax=Naganishia friedmannii TaxID=89922 RepID=A0ACC2UX68_9TREE|nr:hypothetical protein QFC21_007190 [Naganishia friedmannii]
MDLAGVNEPRGYEPNNFQSKGSSADIVSSIFEHRNSTDKDEEGSYVKYGFRFSQLMRMVGFDPTLSSPVDPLHNSFLGLVGSFVNMLFAHELFTKEAADQFVDTFSNAIYPGHLGRIPTRIGMQLTRNVSDGQEKAKKGKQSAKGKGKAVAEGPVGNNDATTPKGTAAAKSQKRGKQPANSSAPKKGQSTTVPPSTVAGEATAFKKAKGKGRAELPQAPVAETEAPSPMETRGRKRKGDERKDKGPTKKPEPLNQAEQEDAKTGKLGTGIKADTWKRIAQILPVALVNAWGMHRINDFSSETPSVAEGPDGSRHTNGTRSLWYQAALGLCAGLRILHAHNITYDDARMGVDILAGVAKSLLSLGAKLTINWHISMHYAEFVRLYGPLSGFGTWAFERHNGNLSNVNHNGKLHEIPTTLMRRWVAESRLVSVLSNPARDVTDNERQQIEDLLADRDQVRGTLMMDELDPDSTQLRLPRPVYSQTPVDLSKPDYDAYNPLFEYIRCYQPAYSIGHLSQLSLSSQLLPKKSSAYQLRSHIVLNGFNRTTKNRYALMSWKQPGMQERRRLCYIELFLGVNLPVEGHREPLKAQLALVKIFEEIDQSRYPWQPRYVDCGIRTFSNVVESRRFIPITDLQATTIIILTRMFDCDDALVSISCDTEGPEPEYWLKADSDEGMPVNLEGEEGIRDSERHAE